MREFFRIYKLFRLSAIFFAVLLVGTTSFVLLEGRYSFAVKSSVSFLNTAPEEQFDINNREIINDVHEDVIFTEDIRDDNNISRLLNVVSGWTVSPLIPINQSSSSILNPMRSNWMFPLISIGKRIDKDTYVNIIYDKTRSSLALILPSTDFKLSDKVIRTDRVILSEISRVPSAGLIKLGPVFVPISDDLNVSVKLGIIANSPIQIYKESGSDLLSSFEDELWQVEPNDCSDSMAGLPEMEISTSDDATEGEKSMRISSNNHYACAFHTYSVNFENDKIYELKFDYKNVSGGKMMYYYSFKKSPQHSGYSFSEKISSRPGAWNSQHVYIDPKNIISTDASSQVSFEQIEPGNPEVNYSELGTYFDQTTSGGVKLVDLYLYAPSDGRNKVENLFDNVSISSYMLISSGTFDVSGVLGSYKILARFKSKFKDEENVKYVPNNQLPNILDGQSVSFEEDELWQVEPNDCSDSMAGLPEMEISTSDDATEGEKSMRISSNNHYACAFHTYSVNFENDKIYELKFDYKNVSGGKMMYYYNVSNGEQSSSQSRTITANKKTWRTEASMVDSGIINPKQLTLGLYAPSTGYNRSENLYDRIILKEFTKKDIDSYFLFTEKNNTNPTNHSHIKRDPLNYRKVELRSLVSPFVLKYSAPYSEKYIAKFSSRRINNSDHYRLNKFENGWYIDPVELCGTKDSLKEGCTMNPDGSYNMELVIEFTPQRWFNVGLLISGTTLFGCFAYLGYDFYRRRKNREVSVLK